MNTITYHMGGRRVGLLRMIFLYSLLLWLFFPILVSLVLFVFSVYYCGKHRMSLPVNVILLFAVSFGIVAFNAEQGSTIICDLIRYRDYYETVSDHSYGYGFSGNILFDSITWFLAHYITRNPRFVGFFWVTVSVFFFLLGARNLIYYYFKNNNPLRTLCLYAIVLFIPFVMVFELLKQCVAMSMILYAISLTITGSKRGWIVVLCAFFIHIGSVALYFPLLFWKKRWIDNHKTLWLTMSLIVGLIGIMTILSFFNNIPIFQILSLSEKLQAYAEFDAWGGSKRFYVMLLFYALQVGFIYMCPEVNRPKGAVFSVLVLCSLLLNVTSNHNLARMINVNYVFNSMAFIMGVAAMRRIVNKKMVITMCLFVLLSSTIIQYTSNVANNYYLIYMNNSISDIFGSNIVECFSATTKGVSYEI